MYIKEIKLKNFRNYNEEKIELNEKTNIIYGDNAQGKTNIIEAIYLSSLGKSFRTKNEKELIKFNENKAEIEVKYQKKDREGKVNIIIENRKELYLNDIKMKKLSDILGNIYVVIFSPENINILNDDPSKRRKFLDIMISQIKPMYAHILNQYKKVLEQKNNYIKQIKFEGKLKQNLDIWDEQLAEYSIKINEYRKIFIEKLNKKIEKIHFDATNEKIEIKYKTDVIEKQKYLNRIKENRENDIRKGYSTIGVHRDDFEIFIKNKDVSIYGSQGQKRTSIISLKLAEAEVIYEEKQEFPIILLDYFMSELDEKRIKGFIENIQNNQVLITCTKKIEFDEKKCKFFKIENAKIY